MDPLPVAVPDIPGTGILHDRHNAIHGNGYVFRHHGSHETPASPKSQNRYLPATLMLPA